MDCQRLAGRAPQAMTEEFTIKTAEERDGAFVRQQSRFRDWITADGSSGFAPEAGRYHLYVSRACPWAHRTIIGRRLMGLEGTISISFVDPIRDARGWAFTVPGRYEDPVNGFAFLSDAYLLSDPGFADRVTVPGPLGQTAPDDRQQRVAGDPEDALDRVRAARRPT